MIYETSCMLIAGMLMFTQSILPYEKKIDSDAASGSGKSNARNARSTLRPLARVITIVGSAILCFSEISGIHTSFYLSFHDPAIFDIQG